MKITPIQLAKRVEKWAKVLAPLGVAHFEFSVVLTDDIPPDGQGQAAANISSHYDVVKFYFLNSYIEECTEDQLDQTIVHEWMHVAMRDLDETLQTVCTWMPPATYTDWEETVTHEREGIVDRLATLVIQLERGRKPRFTP